MVNVLFLTAAYPYYPGEQFIEDEIGFWANKPGVNVVCIPATADGQARPFPDSVEVCLSMASHRTFIDKSIALISAVFSKIFLREIWSLIATGSLNGRRFIVALRASASVYRLQRPLRMIAKRFDTAPVAYCYWSDVQSYAAALLKREGLLSKVVSRAHGFDVYQERRVESYMPLKRQFVSDLDYIFPVSEQAKVYLEKKYGFESSKVFCRPLGVAIPEQAAKVSDETGEVHIVSISYCIKLKRIEKIISAIAMAAECSRGIKIKWTHVGDGPERERLIKMATDVLSRKGVIWNFVGQLPNHKVKDFLMKEKIDFLINTSESEGVPVSMMEAMSYGIPVVGPRVGGIAELVSEKTGMLLSADPSVEEVAETIVSMFSIAKTPEIRNSAREWVAEKYSSDKNYRSIVDFITSLCGARR